MLIDRYTKTLLTIIAAFLAALVTNTVVPLRELRMLIEPAAASAQSECPAVAKGTLPRNYRLVGTWGPMNVPRPDPRLVFETDDAFWLVAAEWYYRNLESGNLPGCVHLKIKKG